MSLSVFHSVFVEINDCSMSTHSVFWELFGETEESLCRQSRKLALVLGVQTDVGLPQRPGCKGLMSLSLVSGMNHFAGTDQPFRLAVRFKLVQT